MDSGATIINPPPGYEAKVPQMSEEQGYVFVDSPNPRMSPGNFSSSSVFSAFTTYGSRGVYGAALAKERVVKPQAFSEAIAFTVQTKKGPCTFLYKTPKGSSEPKLYAHEGELTGVAGQLGKGVEKVNVAKFSGMINEAVKTADFAEVAFSEEAPPPKDIELSHGYVGQVGYFTGDPWSVVASVESLRQVVLGVTPDAGVMNKFTSSFGLVTGAICMLDAVKAKRAAEHIGDTEGLLNQKIRLVRGAEEVVSGGIMVGVRSVGLAASLPTASKTILLANKILGYLSTASGSLLYGLLMLPFIFDAAREGKFLYEFAKQKADGVSQAFMYLVDKIGLNRKDIDEVEKVISFKSPQELYDMVKDGETIPEKLHTILTSDEMKAIEDRVMSLMQTMDRSQFPLISDWNQVRDCLLAKVLKEGCRLVGKKKAEYTRRSSFGSYTDIREKMMHGEIAFNGVQFSISAESVSVEFQEKMNVMATNEAQTNLMLNTFVTFVCIIGIASFIGATVFTGGAPLLVSLIVMLVMNILMSGVDLYAFIEELKAMKKSSTNDLITIAIFVLMSMFSLGISFMFAGGTVAKSVIVALGVIMIAFQGGAAYEVYQKLDGEEDEELEIRWKAKAQTTHIGKDLRQDEEVQKLERRVQQVRAALSKGGFGI